jgi:predicted dehydrogenase
MAKKSLAIALIGQGFMGRAHSNAWSQVNKFFDLPLAPVLHTACGRDAERLSAFAQRWQWQNTSTRYKQVVHDPKIDLIDVVVPNNMHRTIVLEALKAGKAVACEKPLADNLDDARDMVQAARKAKVKTFVWYNYRRCPAVALAHQLVREGRIGSIRHVRAAYLQDWAMDESIPLAWRFDARQAGSGSHGDLNAHIIDMARFITGEEITEICGGIVETFVKQRQLMTGAISGGLSLGLKSSAKKGKVTVDDSVIFLARMEGGAIASFEATRMATGNQNRNGFEINGAKGALRFNFERMNELEFYDATAERRLQGWRTMIITHGGDHPYAAAWWPDAHVIGYEHGFTNMAYDIVLAMAGKKPTVPLPDFEDAFITQRILQAMMTCAKEKRWVKVAEIK